MCVLHYMPIHLCNMCIDICMCASEIRHVFLCQPPIMLVPVESSSDTLRTQFPTVPLHTTAKWKLDGGFHKWGYPKMDGL